MASRYSCCQWIQWLIDWFHWLTDSLIFCGWAEPQVRYLICLLFLGNKPFRHLFSQPISTVLHLLAPAFLSPVEKKKKTAWLKISSFFVQVSPPPLFAPTGRLNATNLPAVCFSCLTTLASLSVSRSLSRPAARRRETLLPKHHCCSADSFSRYWPNAFPPTPSQLSSPHLQIYYHVFIWTLLISTNGD